MEWYLIVIIAVGSLIGLFLLILLLGKVFKPKFKHHKKQVVSPMQKPSETPIVSSSVGQMVGLNLDNKLRLEEDVFFDEPNKKTPPTPPRRTLDTMGFEDFKKKLKAKQQKTLLEQIRELSPELKALIFDRGLARKDYEFMSKKD